MTQLQTAVVEPVYGWLTACDEEMICARIGVANLSDSYASAKAKLRALIDWHIEMAVSTDGSAVLTAKKE